MVSKTWSAACYCITLELENLADEDAHDQAVAMYTDLYKSNDLRTLLSAQSMTNDPVEIFLKDEGLLEFLRELCELGFNVEQEYEGVGYAFHYNNCGK